MRSTLATLVLPLLLQTGPASHSADEVPAIEAVIRHVAADMAGTACKNEDCYVAIAGGVPAEPLLARIGRIPNVAPLPERVADRSATAMLLDVFSIEYPATGEAKVGVDFVVAGDILFGKCWYFVRRESKKWRVNRKESGCAPI